MARDNSDHDMEEDGDTSDEEYYAIEEEKRPKVPLLSVFRSSPRPCINQGLVDALKPIRDSRFLVFGSGHSKSIAYATAISAVIGCPYKITTRTQALLLPKISCKIIEPVDEYLKKGYIKDALPPDVLHPKKFHALTELTKIHGLGPATAMSLWDQGIRSLSQLKATGQYAEHFKYLDDVSNPMSRTDVESVHEFIRLQLDRVEPGAHTILCGSYRRGKTHSNDCDIVITFPHRDGLEKGVLRRLVHRLQAKGFIPSDGILTLVEPATFRTTVENRNATLLDSLDKALVYFRHPPNSTDRPKAIMRRVDLIVTRWPSYGAAVMGWTGSTQFERDLRRHAHNKGLKFDSGALRNRVTNGVIPTQTEQDVFRALGIPWLDPHLRNADP